MSKIVKKLSWVAAACAFCISFNLSAEYKKSDQAAKPTPEMEAVMKAATPGEHHQVLNSFVGSWTHTIRFWMKPGGKPQVSQGTDENKWILDGRFVQMEAKGEANGQPFQGIGLSGYDNVSHEYTSVWADNMSTGMMRAFGQYDAATQTLKQSGTFNCPMMGKEIAFRSEWKVVNRDKHTYQMHMKGENGKEFKALEIVYARVK